MFLVKTGPFLWLTTTNYYYSHKMDGFSIFVGGANYPQNEDTQ